MEQKLCSTTFPSFLRSNSTCLPLNPPPERNLTQVATPLSTSCQMKDDFPGSSLAYRTLLSVSSPMIQYQGHWHTWTSMHAHIPSQSCSLLPKMTLQGNKFLACALVPNQATVRTWTFLCQVCLIPVLGLKTIQTWELLGVLRAAASRSMVGLMLLLIKWQTLDLQLPRSIVWSIISQPSLENEAKMRDREIKGKRVGGNIILTSSASLEPAKPFSYVSQ